ncbi:MAG TPA: aminotransferase class III-fold pyridoxal phosphate-dependent enzyme, partial [Candidatus Dormibacteraeota bacterium]|nr:aminotransferase class III-fold pyridoxal phosphate-dependent enzyme [Candidatus Dormibacteraeota bacterium]
MRDATGPRRGSSPPRPPTPRPRRALHSTPPGPARRTDVRRAGTATLCRPRCPPGESRRGRALPPCHLPETDLTSDLDSTSGVHAHTRLAGRAAAVLAGGATHIARSYHPGLFVVRASGARKTLVDGRELVDYTMGHGALLLGHAHPVVVDAVRRQVACGTHFGAGSELEVAWAEAIAGLVPSVERVRFTSSGTEATMLALRLARAWTGRDVVVTVDDHFHGWHDAVVSGSREDGVVVAPPGVPRATAALTRIVDPRDRDSLVRALRDRAAAALILEASGAHYGRVPLPASWVSAARAACDDTGTLLVFDEVVTGFRVRPGGMQELLGVRPDLSCFAKILGGGLPCGAVGGRADVMELLAADAGGHARVEHPGTFNANPLSAAAGCATLAAIRDGRAQRRAADAAAELERIWVDALAGAGVPGRAWRLESIVHVRLDDAATQAALGGAMREAGVDLL